MRFKKMAALAATGLLLFAACGDDYADVVDETIENTYEGFADEEMDVDQPDVEAYGSDSGTPVNSRDGSEYDGGYAVIGHDTGDDGYYDAYTMDRWNDGTFDTFCSDSNQNLLYEVCFVDYNNDAFLEVALIDDSGNGVFDRFLWDTNLTEGFELVDYDVNENGVLDSGDSDPVFSNPDRGYSVVGGVMTRPDWLTNLMTWGINQGAGVTFPPGDGDGDGTFDSDDNCPYNPGAYDNWGC